MTAITQTRPILAGAAAAARRLSHGLAARVTPFTYLFRHSFEIEALNRAALDPNPGLHPAVIGAHVRQAGNASRVRLVMIHDPEGVLRAFAPIVLEGPRRILGVARTLVMPGAGDGMALVDSAMPRAATVLVDALAELGGARLDHVAVGSATARLIIEAARAAVGIRVAVLASGQRSRLDCHDSRSVKGWLDTDYLADLTRARRSLAGRFGKLELQRFDSGPDFANAYARFRALARDAGAGQGQAIDELARAQNDDACLVIHRLTAGGSTLGMALGLAVARRYRGLGVCFDRSRDAPAAPPVLAVMLAEALAADPGIDDAFGGACILTPSWKVEPVASLLVGPAAQVEAERALEGLRGLIGPRPSG